MSVTSLRVIDIEILVSRPHQNKWANIIKYRFGALVFLYNIVYFCKSHNVRMSPIVSRSC